ncbi:MAG: alpha/beta hydrolase-fold protein [Bacteroidia bacterium]|nr:alpha/beta hydrolase-fold protein [Bacteroidia bacterium]
MKTRITILTALFCISLSASAQDGYTVKHDSLQSEVLKQNRKLSIFLPEGYDSSKSKFPVLYVLDADGRDQHTVPTARFLFLNNRMPKVIVIGVFNIDRNHDFLPDSSQSATSGGGADNFVQFFKKDLIPYIDNNFKTVPYKVLIGHSFGGIFAMHALLSDPDLFDAYIAIDPSFWYKNQMLIKNAQNEFLKAKNWKKSIFITGREGGGMKDMAITSMEKLLKSSAPSGLNWKVVAYSDEDHGSVPFKSVYDGLRFIFDVGGNFMVYPHAGILPKGTSTYALIENRNPNLRYTTDGTEPTINSPLCKDKIEITKACTLKVKSVSTKYNNLPSMTRIFTEGEFMNGQQSIENLKPGLKYSYYEGVWDSVPDFSKLTPKKTGITDNIDLKFALKKDSFAVQFEGYLHITKKDLYNLWVVSDDGSKVYFNNQLLLDNDGLHAAERPIVKLVPLNPGYYPIMIRYFERTGNEVVTIGSVAGKKKPVPVPFPKEMLFYKE